MDDASSDAPVDWAGLEVLGPEDCGRRLRAAPIGRLGFVDAGEPVILPINFLWHDDKVVFRTAHGSKLSAAMLGRPVCLEIDGWNAIEHNGFSVLLKGIAEEVIDESTIAALEGLPIRPWSRPDLRVHWVLIRPTEITGRAIRQRIVD